MVPPSRLAARVVLLAFLVSLSAAIHATLSPAEESDIASMWAVQEEEAAAPDEQLLALPAAGADSSAAGAAPPSRWEFVVARCNRDVRGLLQQFEAMAPEGAAVHHYVYDKCEGGPTEADDWLDAQPNVHRSALANVGFEARPCPALAAPTPFPTAPPSRTSTSRPPPCFNH